MSFFLLKSIEMLHVDDDDDDVMMFVYFLSYPQPVPGSQIVGKKRKQKALLSPVSSRFIFVFALFQFSGPDYLRAWNRLSYPVQYEHYPISREFCVARRSFFSLQKSFLCVNRTPIRYACFPAGAKVIRYSMKMAVTESCYFYEYQH